MLTSDAFGKEGVAINEPYERLQCFDAPLGGQNPFADSPCLGEAAPTQRAPFKLRDLDVEEKRKTPVCVVLRKVLRDLQAPGPTSFQSCPPPSLLTRPRTIFLLYQNKRLRVWRVCYTNQ